MNNILARVSVTAMLANLRCELNDLVGIAVVDMEVLFERLPTGRGLHPADLHRTVDGRSLRHRLEQIGLKRHGRGARPMQRGLTWPRRK